jgi:hypothetical protein
VPLPQSVDRRVFHKQSVGKPADRFGRALGKGGDL